MFNHDWLRRWTIKRTITIRLSNHTDSLHDKKYNHTDNQSDKHHNNNLSSNNCCSYYNWYLDIIIYAKYSISKHCRKEQTTNDDIQCPETSTHLLENDKDINRSESVL
ncbi:uncharacterized protein LOC132718501 isoform X2 [Ruditapes philippinarum]|uniref:uncharacterized protein LOC132718501 isoform X2 n=1 Tax=Ruditapes philippinarum TaxID=129788 RepID=UPI00295B3EB7|nr:uncharacterized protein LOC132718501 isoform X2 [Ruditapes philippinarum]